MKAKLNCLLCLGKGVIIDPDPTLPARICSCSKGARGESITQGIPARYRDISIDGFWKWWKGEFPDERIQEELNSARILVENEHCKETIPIDLQNKIAGILSKCASRNENEKGWETIRFAQEPNGFGALKTWINRSHRDRDICLWWIDGPPGSGRSSLASAVLQAWCEKVGSTGLFVRVQTFSQELKNTYYDSRSWQNSDFISERDRMAPLEMAPCLVLDDFHRIDTDIRVVRAFAQLLDYRWSELLPTIITATKWAESLQADGESYPIMKLEDVSLLNRLSQARRVELVPTLSRIMRTVSR
ncbi:MAG: hypothetical protein FWG02_04570 [Holophagaceae bacterium]|nr:hypothetical protein [Holophagaceae bacterium]